VQRGKSLDQRAVELGIAADELRMVRNRRDRSRKRAERRLVEGKPDRVRRQLGTGVKGSSPGGQLDTGEVPGLIAV